MNTSQYAYQMSISHQEFMRLLPVAIAERPYLKKGNMIYINETEQREVAIHLSEEGEHKIAMLCLPSTTVTFNFSGYDKQEEESFLTYFHKRFQRGGG